MSENKILPECIDPEIGAQLLSYSLGMLKESEIERFEHHFLHCLACQHELEEAMPELNMLSKIREPFVLRAHQEKQDFESQIDRLKPKAIPIAARVPSSKSFWEIVWGRKWIVGPAFAVVMTLVIMLRIGPVPAPVRIDDKLPDSTASTFKMDDEQQFIPHAAKNPELIEQMAGATDLGGVPEAAQQSHVNVVEKPAHSTAPQAKTEFVPARPLTPSAKPSSVKTEEFVTAKDEAIEQKMEASEQVLMLAEREQPISASQENLQKLHDELWPPISAKDDAALSDEPVSQPLDKTGFSARSITKSRPAAKNESEVSKEQRMDTGTVHSEGFLAKQSGFKADARGNIEEGSGPSRKTKLSEAEELYNDNKFNEARVKYQEVWHEDSTEANVAKMIGLASLALRDYPQAKTALEAAQKLKPTDAQEKEIEMLLVQVDLLTGNTESAKARLRSFLGAEDSRKEFAKRAIIKIDSFETARGLKQQLK